MQNYQALIDGFVSAMLKSAGDSNSGGLKGDVSLMPHQQDAVRKGVDRDGNIIFAHKVGIGKTLTSIATFEALKEKKKASKALVVVPAALRENYLLNGINKFTKSKGVILGNSQEISQEKYHSVDKPPKADYYVVSYDMYRKNPEKYIKNTGADTVIYDELHKIKNDDSVTYEALKRARPLHRNFIGLTGSVVSNSPADIVPLVDAMTYGNHNLGDKGAFKRKFIGTDRKGNEIIKRPELLKKTLDRYIDFVENTANGKMPKKIIAEEFIQMSPHQNMLYKHVMNQLDPVTAAKIRMGATDIKKRDISNIFTQIIRARQVSNAVHTMDNSYDLSRSARETPKVKKLIDDVEEHLKETPDGHAVVHTQLVHGGIDVLEQGFRDRGIEPAVFIGKGQPGITEEKRQQGVKDYLGGKKKVMIISSAGSEGLSLGNTTMVAGLDGHFNPERILQSEARGVRADSLLHRPEEKRQVLVKRYYSAIPKEEAGALRKILNIIPLFRARKETSTDEWIKGVSDRKLDLNTKFKSVFDKAAEDEELIKMAADYCCELSDLLKEADGFDIPKTQDKYNIPEEIPKETSKILKSFMDKHKVYPAIYLDKSIRNPFFKAHGKNPGVYIKSPKNNSAAILHEFGHAKDYEKLPYLKAISRGIPLYGGLAGIAGLIMRNPKLKNYGMIASGLGSLPILYQEGKADLLAMKHIAGEKGKAEARSVGLKYYLPAFGTYLASPIATALSFHPKLKSKALPLRIGGVAGGYLLSKMIDD